MSPLKPYSISVLELIEACLSDDRTAQKELFELYAPTMMALALRYCRDSHEAEDVLQEGFVKIFSNLYQYSGKGNFEGWMKKIFINIALKNKTKKSYTNEIPGLDPYMETSVMPTIIDSLSEDEITQVIDSMPEGYKRVFNLYVIEGYSHKEIGELLKIGESTSRSQLVKARKMMQSKLLNSQKLAV